MTEQPDRANWDLDRRVAHEYELRQKREAWEKQRREQRDQEQRAHKRAALESYLQNRAQAWADTTGSSPPSSVIDGWQRQYMDEQELLRQAEREAKLAEAESQYPY